MAGYDYYSMINQSQRLGYGRNYICSMRQHSNDQYCYIMALSPTKHFEDGQILYLKKHEKVVTKFLKLYSELEERRHVTAFDRSYGLTPYSTAKWGTRALVKKISFKGFRYLELLIPKMEEYIEKNTRKIGCKKNFYI